MLKHIKCSKTAVHWDHGLRCVTMKLLNPAGVIQTQWAMNIREIELSFVESLCWTVIKSSSFN